MKKNPKKGLFCLVWILCSSILCLGETPAAKAFALTNSGSRDVSTLLQHKAIDGLALQEAWAILEPREGVYRWDRLDSVLKAARQNHKMVSLHLMGSPRVPGWLSAAGAEFYSSTDFRGRPVRDVVPWDPIYLKLYSRFVRDLARHLRQAGLDSTVFALGAVAPVSECNIIGGKDGYLGRVPYDREAYLRAHKSMLDVYCEAFPQAKIFVSPPVREMICFPDQDTRFYPELMNYAHSRHPGQCWVFAADLNAEGSQRTRPYRSYAKQGLGYQTIWSATNDPRHRMKGSFPQNLSEAVRFGLRNGAEYFEIYSADVLNPNPSIQSALRSIHQ